MPPSILATRIFLWKRGAPTALREVSIICLQNSLRRTRSSEWPGDNPATRRSDVAPAAISPSSTLREHGAKACGRLVKKRPNERQSLPQAMTILPRGLP